MDEISLSYAELAHILLQVNYNIHTFLNWLTKSGFEIDFIYEPILDIKNQESSNKFFITEIASELTANPGSNAQSVVSSMKQVLLKAKGKNLKMLYKLRWA